MENKQESNTLILLSELKVSHRWNINKINIILVEVTQTHFMIVD